MTWLARLFRRGRLERELDQEVRFHLEQHTADLIARGLAPGEARRQATLALGATESLKEECRDARGTRWLEDLAGDVRYALRSLAHRPGFATVALVTLALGIGATTLIFSLINGVLLAPLPYSDPGRLLVLQEQTDYSTALGNLWSFSKPNYDDLARETTALDLMAFLYNGGTISTPKAAEYVDGFDISANALPLLGVKLFRGRDFTSADDRPGAPPVAILGYTAWQSLFDGDPDIVGKQLTFDQKPYTIVGVAPAGFQFEGNPGLVGAPGIFLPLGQENAPFLARRDRHGLQVWGRLHAGATLAEARAQLNVVGARLASAFPDSNKGRTFIGNPLRPAVGSNSNVFVGNTRSTLWLLFGAVTLVLLIACVNVASLLLARAVSRRRELAVRVALGAGRGRVIRQCLTESAVLAVLGGALGILLAYFAIQPFVRFWPQGLPRADEVRIDGRVLLFAFGVSLLCGLLFGLAPALRVPVRNLEQALRAGARTVAGGSRPLHSGYVISELALAVVLLVSAGILGRTLLRLAHTDPGLDIHNVFTGRVALAGSTLNDPAATRAAWDKIIAAAHTVPGVESVAMVDTVPLRQGNNLVSYSTTAAIPMTDPNLPTLLATSVSPEYLDVMRIPLRRGRFFTADDTLNKPHVAVIDEVLAQKAFPGRDPIGHQIWFGLGDPWTVVGVVAHVRYWGLASDDQAQVRAQMYYPFAQVPDTAVRRWSQLMSIAVRTSVETGSVLPALRQAVRGATGDQVIYQVNTMEQLAAGSIARQRFLVLLFGLFAGLALLLACIGIYGVLAYLTNQRVPELGVRIALGASPAQVLQLVLSQSLRLIVVGVAIGVAASFAATRLLAGAVDGVRPTDPLTFALMILVLSTAALLASFLPARRASRINPLIALRQE